LALYYRFYQLDKNEEVQFLINLKNKITITQFLQLDELANSPFLPRLIEGFDLMKELNEWEKASGGIK
jgi:hypothetical protein